MSEKTKIWNDLFNTDPKFTKQFDKGRFKGTAINATWEIKRMTEVFGPIGVGWKTRVTKREIIPVETTKEIMVFTEVEVQYKLNGEWSEPVYGIGGDYIVKSESKGLRTDDEAFKKCTTDALTNALKQLGLGADIHMGLWDDSKYVNTIEKKFSGEGGIDPGWPDNHPVSKEEAGKIYKEAVEALEVVSDRNDMESWQKQYSRLVKQSCTTYQINSVSKKFKEKTAEIGNRAMDNGHLNGGAH